MLSLLIESSQIAFLVKGLMSFVAVRLPAPPLLKNDVVMYTWAPHTAMMMNILRKLIYVCDCVVDWVTTSKSLHSCHFFLPVTYNLSVISQLQLNWRCSLRSDRVWGRGCRSYRSQLQLCRPLPFLQQWNSHIESGSLLFSTCDPSSTSTLKLASYSLLGTPQ